MQHTVRKFSQPEVHLVLLVTTGNDSFDIMEVWELSVLVEELLQSLVDLLVASACRSEMTFYTLSYNMDISYQWTIAGCRDAHSTPTALLQIMFYWVNSFYKIVSYLCFYFPSLNWSLMIGWRKNSWNPEKVSSVFTFVFVSLSICVCVSTGYRVHLLTWEPNFRVEWSLGHEKKCILFCFLKFLFLCFL